MGREGERRKISPEYFIAPLFELIDMILVTLLTGTLEMQSFISGL